MEVFKKAAMIFWAVVWLSVLFYWFSSSADTKEYLQNPLVGDIYYVNYAKIDEIDFIDKIGIFKDRAFSVMKLVHMDDSYRYFLLHRSYGTKGGAVLTFSKDNADAYFQSHLILSKERVLELYKNNAIQDIIR